jgi:hypothetical protein
MVGTPSTPKRLVTNRTLKGFVIAKLNARKAFILCRWMLGVVHSEDIHNHPVDYLCMYVGLRLEGGQFGELGVHR